jgi:HK97 family phage prohead protease
MSHPELALDVIRALGDGTELRHDGADGLGTLVLRFSQFNTWYEVDSLWEGLFLERTKRGAFSQTIAEDRASMRVLFDHGMDFQLGNKVLGPIDDLREDSDSPVGEVPLFDTSYNRDLLPGLQAGVYGSSMRMRVLEEKWNDEPKASAHNPKGIPERTIERVKVMEFGPVTFPANPEATAEMASAGVRSMTDEFYERLRHRDEPAYEAAVRAAAATRPDFTGRGGQRMAPGGDPDAEPGNGEASQRPNSHEWEFLFRMRRPLYARKD